MNHIVSPRPMPKRLRIFLCAVFVGCAAPALAEQDAVFADADYREAQTLIKAGSLQKAYRLLHKIAEDYPDHPVVLNNLAVVAARLGDFAMAQKLLERAIKVYPYAAGAYTNLQNIYAYRAAQNYKDALDLSAPVPELSVQLIEELPSTARSTTVADARSNTEADAFRKKALADKALNKPFVEEPAEAQPTGQATDANSAELRQALTGFVKSWAQAWSSQDAESYFEHYVIGYRPRKTISNASWRARRSERLRAPKSIRIRVSNIRIKKRGDDYILSFTQGYRSNLLHSTVLKQLGVRKVQGQWKIFRERVIKK